MEVPNAKENAACPKPQVRLFFTGSCDLFNNDVPFFFQLGGCWSLDSQHSSKEEIQIGRFQNMCLQIQNLQLLLSGVSPEMETRVYVFNLLSTMTRS